MKTLMLIRHAKSSWDYPYLTDKERPLKNRGIKDALLIGKHLSTQMDQSALFWSSPARRANDTAILIAKQMEFCLMEIETYDNLYFGDIHQFKQDISNVPAPVQTICCFGHMPTLANWASVLGRNEMDHIPTAAACILKWEEAEDWHVISTQKSDTLKVITPKMLKN